MHVFLTGASSGIGEALARAYAERRAALTLVARRGDLLHKLAGELGGTCNVVVADLTSADAGVEALAYAEQALGPVDVLINNAGVQIVGRTVDLDWTRAEALLALNVTTPLRLTLAALPAMMARGKGCIVDIASIAALAPTPGMFIYNASKAALAAASEGLRGEIRGTGVHIVTVYPGPVRTAMEEAARQIYEQTIAARWAPTGRADELARLIVKAVEKGRPRVIYPRIYRLVRHFPNLTRIVIDRATPPVRVLVEGK